MKFANAINSLVVKFVRMDYDEEHQWEMLVMERLYSMDYRSLEFEKRVVITEVFEDELKQLHKGRFVHRDLNRPSNISGEPYDNIFLTANGIRLIDVSISAIRHQVGDKLFHKICRGGIKGA